MSLAERYSRAARSSDLELKVEVGDVDYLIAAGLVRESLATRLIRLRSEFDGLNRARGAMKLLRGFPMTRDVLVAHAIDQAPVRSTLDSGQAMVVALRVLDLFLDPNCPVCTGRCFNGDYGSPTLRCTNCRETGKRLMYWKTDAEDAFARWLQSSMEGKIDRALVDIRRHMKERLPEMKRLLRDRV